MALELTADLPEENVLDRYMGEPVKVFLCASVCVCVHARVHVDQPELVRIRGGGGGALHLIRCVAHPPRIRVLPHTQTRKNTSLFPQGPNIQRLIAHP